MNMRLPALAVAAAALGTIYVDNIALAEVQHSVQVVSEKRVQDWQDVDNTGVNQRDASGHTKTPVDQSNTEADIKITQQIRAAVTDDESLSVNAQNVKIITEQGNVTLRGPVESEQERNKVVSVARQVAGPSRVSDQLDVAGLNDE